MSHANTTEYHQIYGKISEGLFEVFRFYAVITLVAFFHLTKSEGSHGHSSLL